MESASKPPVNADDFDRQLAINPNRYTHKQELN